MKKISILLIVPILLFTSCEEEKFKPIITIQSPEGGSTTYANLSMMNIKVNVADIDKDLKETNFRIIRNDDSSVIMDTTIVSPPPVDVNYLYDFNWQVYNPSPTYLSCKITVKATDYTNRTSEESLNISLN